MKPRETSGLARREPAASASRVLVIGAGVSGSVAAIRLVHHGCDVTLMERAAFPREKICGCCLGAAGLTALDAIGLGHRVRELGSPTHTFVAYLLGQEGGPSRRASSLELSPIRVRLQSGVAISRSVLDTFLIQHARAQGVRVLQPCVAQVVDSTRSGTLVRYRKVDSPLSKFPSPPSASPPWTLTDEYDLVVVATGLTGVFSGGGRAAGRDSGVSSQEISGVPSSPSKPSAERWKLPWIDPPHGPLGIATHLPSRHPGTESWDLPVGEIQMICGDDGYVGLVRLPGGGIDIAAALQSRKQRLPDDENSLAASPHCSDTTARFLDLLRRHPDAGGTIDESFAVWLKEQADVMTAPPLRRRRHAGEGRVVAIGDCAGYVEPMTGEGMTWGIESGLAVADLWQRASTRSDFSAQWKRELRRLQPKRRWMCSEVTRAMRSSKLRRLTRILLGRAPWLAAPLTRGLAVGPKFAATQRSSRGQRSRVDSH